MVEPASHWHSFCQSASDDTDFVAPPPTLKGNDGDPGVKYLLLATLKFACRFGNGVAPIFHRYANWWLSDQLTIVLLAKVERLVFGV